MSHRARRTQPRAGALANSLICRREFPALLRQGIRPQAADYRRVFRDRSVVPRLLSTRFPIFSLLTGNSDEGGQGRLERLAADKAGKVADEPHRVAH